MKYSSSTKELLLRLLDDGRLNYLYLGQESIGFDVSFNDEFNVENIDYLSQSDFDLIKQLFHDFAWDNADKVSWGFYDIKSLDGRIAVECSGERTVPLGLSINYGDILRRIIPDDPSTAIDFSEWVMEMEVNYSKEEPLNVNLDNCQLMIHQEDGDDIEVTKILKEKTLDVLIEAVNRAEGSDWTQFCYGDLDCTITVSDESRFDLEEYFD